MMEHEPSDQDILRVHLQAGRDSTPPEPWAVYRLFQLLEWYADNIERIKRMAQGGPVSERVPDRLPQDSTLWTQDRLHWGSDGNAA